MEIPEAQMKLNPRWRLFPVVTEAMTGASATGQTEDARPVKAANMSNAGAGVIKARSAQSPAVSPNDAISVRRIPKCWIAKTLRMHPATFPAVLIPDMSPRKSSRNPSCNR
jgi:hypothetical protein